MTGQQAEHLTRRSTEDDASASSASAPLWTARVLRVLGLLLLAFVIAMGVIAYGQVERVAGRDATAPDRFTLVLGTWFPTLWDVMIWPAVLGAVALLASAVIRPTQGTVRRRVARSVATAIASVATALSLLLAGIVTGADAIGSSGPGLSVLHEESAGGCRIVVNQHSFLFAGGGRVGILQPGSIVVEWVRSYRSDDGLTPFGHGGAGHVRWEGRVAEIEAGTRGEPVWWYGDEALVCNE